jgi:hypothetical protein
MNMRCACLMCAVLLLSVQCKSASGKKPSPMPSATVAAMPAPQPAPSMSVAQAPTDPVAVPTEEDFEDQVAQDITSKNLESQLDKLEKEIGR